MYKTENEAYPTPKRDTRNPPRRRRGRGHAQNNSGANRTPVTE